MQRKNILILLFSLMALGGNAQTNNQMDERLYEPSTYMDQRDFEQPVIKGGIFVVGRNNKSDTMVLSGLLRTVFYDSSTKRYSLEPYHGFDSRTTYYSARIAWNNKGDNKLFEINSRENGSVTDHWEEPVWYRREDRDKKKGYYREKLEYMPTHKFVTYDPDFGNGFEVNAVYQNLATNDLVLVEKKKENDSVLNLFIAKPSELSFRPVVKLKNAAGLQKLYATGTGDLMTVICKSRVIIVNVQTGATELDFEVPEHEFNDFRIFNMNNILCIYVSEGSSKKKSVVLRLDPANHRIDTIGKNGGSYYPHVYIGDDLKTAFVVQYGTGKGVTGHQVMQYVTLNDMNVLATVVCRDQLNGYEVSDSLSKLFAQLGPIITGYVAQDIKEMEQKGYTLCAQKEQIKFSKDSVYTYVVYFPNGGYLSLNFDEFDNIGNKKSSGWSIRTSKGDDQKYLTYLYGNKLARAQVNFSTDKGYYATLKDFIIWSISSDNAVAPYYNFNKRYDIRFYKKKREAGDNNLVIKEMPYTNYVFPPEPAVKTNTPTIPAGKKLCSACLGRKYAAALVEVNCKPCSGRGRVKCQTCNGSAQMYNIYTHKTVACPKCLAGYSTCGECEGKGKAKVIDPSTKCGKCNGLGYN